MVPEIGLNKLTERQKNSKFKSCKYRINLHIYILVSKLTHNLTLQFTSTKEIYMYIGINKADGEKGTQSHVMPQVFIEK